MTNKIIFAIYLSTIIFFVSPCHSQNIAFMSGQKFLELEKDNKVSYTMGLVDGIYIAPLFSGRQRSDIWFEECTREMKSGQIVAILEKYLAEHHEEWHQDISLIAFRAFKNACPEAKNYYDKKIPKK